MANQATTGLGVAAKILVEGNESGNTKPGYNNVVLSVSGDNGPTTFQLNPQIVDVANTPVELGTAFTLTAVAGGSPGPLTLTAVAASINGDAAYTGTITGGGSDAYVGQLFTVAGFTGANNNGQFVCVASTGSVLTLANADATAETHAATATSETGTAVYTGTITGGGSNAFAGQTFVVAGFVTNPQNNGTFIATASSGSNLTLENNAAVAETHAATATSQEASTELTYVVYPAKTLSGGTYNPNASGSTSVYVVTVSADGVLTAVAEGGAVAEVSFPTFNNASGTTGAEPAAGSPPYNVNPNNPNAGLPLNKIYAEVNVTVIA